MDHTFTLKSVSDYLFPEFADGRDKADGAVVLEDRVVGFVGMMTIQDNLSSSGHMPISTHWL